MKALIRKDFYESITAFRMLVVVIAVLGGASILIPGGRMLIAYMVVIASSLTSSLIQQEEREGWQTYAGALPVARKTVVGAKYIFSLGLVVLVSVLAMICQIVAGLREGLAIMPLSTLTQCFAIGLLLPCLTLPLAYQFGTEKGRYIGMFIMILFALGAMRLTSQVSGNVNVMFDYVPAWLVLIVVAVLYVISWWISVKIYQKKEF
ncbi:MAG: ABC-2 transporter permease [Lachnospiraceae bacterium]|nr:ABC-2 transporter permease [Lachnospiraceae bacterium]